MYLYNSATHKKAEFTTHTPGHVEMYTCGPTVYHFAHIGNLRSYIMEDVLEKFLRYSGYSVNRVMNITDVGHLTSDADEGEDKMLKGAHREHKTVMEVAKYYTDAFFDDCRKLNIKRPDVVQPATGLIDDYIKIITKLLDTGYAYPAGGNIYFDTSKLQRYYIFNDHNEEDLAVGVREGVEEDTNKRNKNDFVLWFTKSKFEDQALKWDSPWGVGYPGWHIECSGISMKYNGEYLDLHCGGVDNAFPHHTNEIAQSESYLGHPWCKHWFHVHHLNTTGGKLEDGTSASTYTNETISCDDAMKVYYVDKDGNITESSYKSIAKDDNDNVYAIVQDYLVKTLIIQEVESEDDVYGVKVVSTGNATVKVDGSKYAAGKTAEYDKNDEDVVITVTADKDYTIKTVKIDGEEVELDKNGQYTISKIKGLYKLEVETEKVADATMTISVQYVLDDNAGTVVKSEKPAKMTADKGEDYVTVHGTAPDGYTLVSAAEQYVTFVANGSATVKFTVKTTTP